MRRWQRRSDGSSPAAGKMVVWSLGRGPAVYLRRGAVRLREATGEPVGQYHWGWSVWPPRVESPAGTPGRVK